MKRARLRPQARRDLLAIAQWYAERGGGRLAERFFDAAQQAVALLERHPGLGSPRLGLLVGAEAVRSWGVDGFPVRWFYVEHPDHLDVLRLLGERQSIGRLRATSGP